jgi:hypothetical protein
MNFITGIGKLFNNARKLFHGKVFLEKLGGVIDIKETHQPPMEPEVLSLCSQVPATET